MARGPQYGPSPKDRLPGRDRPGRGGRINPGPPTSTHSPLCGDSLTGPPSLSGPPFDGRAALRTIPELVAAGAGADQVVEVVASASGDGDHVVDNCRRGDRQISSDGSFPSPWPLARRMTRHGEP